ncbi:charged multivesicular body protein 6-like [Rhopilema esculentum]|uniref:charged multivesicular body protein 6-like n=1 Tax=Rhopilema esculentum TaxID=499914 RepID=UPI0031DD0387|eukprot:gene9524-17267_t
MGGLFSRKEQPKKANRITEQDKAILSLKNQRDKLKQYQKKITTNLERERQVAKELLKDGKKDKARLLLKKKKYQESLLTKTDDQLETLEKLVHEIEFAQVQAKVVQNLKVGNDCLTALHKIMTLEDVEKIMEDTQEAVEYQNEIDALISGAFTQEDEDDILAELEELTKVELPSVPTEEPSKETDQLPDVPMAEPSEIEPAKESAKQKPIAVAAS